ncbi:class F sortase [Streptomyces sp. NY05-11A]|uniref:class F sortase n=1 Tax=Streptomyces soliscabiei TaxID=588897 RepID=UPI0029B0BCA6|nr:class F sortase [Streptomyces sp. NY05-11A]MDX2677066.1 class F sortase [Streptomyces sp. NY05-11A]
MSPAPSPVRRFGTLPALARLALVAPVALAVLTGCSSASEKPAVPVASAAAPSAAGAPVPAGGGTAPAGRPAAPAEVAIPSLGITSSLMKLGLATDGAVEVPPAEKGMTAGWYTGGSVPGEPGAAVIIGHNDTRFGRAVFHDLHKIAEGADITVTDVRGKSAHFTVTGTESVSKTSFPTQKVYGPTQDRALRLITCDGDFDAQGHPVNNLIVYATLT